MRNRSIVLALLLGTMVRLPLAGQEPAPWFGTWELDPAQSTEPRQPSPYKRTTFTIESRAEGAKVTYDMVGTRGGRTHLEWTGAFDGRDYPVAGVDYVLTNAYTPVDEASYRILVKLDGVAVATTEVSVSPDGQTLTAVTTERDAAGQALTSTAVYNRR